MALTWRDGRYDRNQAISGMVARELRDQAESEGDIRRSRLLAHATSLEAELET